MEDKEKKERRRDIEDLPEEIIFSPLRTITDTIANKVDRLFRVEMFLLTELTPQIIARLGKARQVSPREGLRLILELLLNAFTTAIAALELWRRGFPLQVGTLLRNAVETIATAALLTTDEKALGAYKVGGFKSTEAFTRLKHLQPDLGAILSRLNGALSGNFTHLGPPLYRGWQAVSPEVNEGDIPALKAMLWSLKGTFHALDLLTELVCYPFCDRPRYWTRRSPVEYHYDPTHEGRQWMEKFLPEEEP